MPDLELIAKVLALLIVGVPALLLLVLGLCSLFERPLSEQTAARSVSWAILAGCLASVGVAITMSLLHVSQLTVSLGNWIALPGYHFSVKLLFDRLSLPFVILTFVLCGTISAFARRYMHREPGYNRFFVLFAIFVLGMTITALAGTIETLFAGWELVGLSSALLVAYFQERPSPVRNGLRVWAVYRVSDAALLMAAVVLHGMRGEGDFGALLGVGSWPHGEAVGLTSQQAFFIGLLLLVAAAGKSALVPFSGWLPRAMEGPTPSSAVFYGALSVHLGTFLLLRTSPILALSAWLCGMIVALGLITALFAAIAGRVQSDIKSALSFASLTQVGIITAEIGLGLYWIALAHMIGHACLRTLQFLRAPSLLHDYHLLENAIGDHLPRPKGFWERTFPPGARAWLYRFGLERGYLDAVLNDFVARPFLALFASFDSWERQWTDFLSGRQSRESDLVKPTADFFEELQ